MTVRVTAVLARTSGSAPCSRCLGFLDITSGRWHAAEANEAHRAVCDRCAEASDPAGYAALQAWRRAARPTRGAAA